MINIVVIFSQNLSKKHSLKSTAILLNIQLIFLILLICYHESVFMTTIDKSFGASFDPFKEASTDDNNAGVQENLIHIRIQQRNGRKTLTTVQGISTDYDLKKIVKACKKEFACNGTVVEHPEYGEVIQLQGDQRNRIRDFLRDIGIAREEQLKVHGF